MESNRLHGHRRDTPDLHLRAPIKPGWKTSSAPSTVRPLFLGAGILAELIVIEAK
jgi:hypothetical protein